MRFFLLSLLLASFLAVGCRHQQHNSPNQTAASQSGSEKAADRPEAIDRLNDSAKILDQLMGTPDSSIPQDVLAKAKCVMVVPSLIKGGLIVGGSHGRGAVTCRTPHGWSAPAFVAIDGGSWGAQIGVESVDVVLVFMNDDGVQSLLNDNFKMGGEASVAAGPVGRDAQAATDAKLNSEILSYSRAKGLFVGLDLNGAAVREDKDSTRGFYGHDVDLRSVLNGTTPKPANAENFTSTVAKYFVEAKAAE